MTTIEREHVVPVVAPVTTRDVLHRAADLLETGEFDWCQGGARVGDGLCMLGAISAALGAVPVGPSLPESVFAMPIYESVLRDLARGARGLGLGTWNDAPGRTREEVVARLREAAETA